MNVKNDNSSYIIPFLHPERQNLDKKHNDRHPPPKKRGHTACAAAYLTPKITSYLTSFRRGFDSDLNGSGSSSVRLDFMKSDGGLTPVDDFGGHQAILSGPAGGVVGYAKTSYRAKSKDNDDDPDREPQPVIGFDMGGTSTDVSRYDGHLDHVIETPAVVVSKT